MHIDNICVYMAHACFMSVVVTVLGSLGMFVMLRPLLKIVGVLSIGVLKYGVCLCRGYDGCCVFCLLVVLCCLLLGPDCSYILQSPA